MDYDFEIASPPSETILRRISDLDINLKMFKQKLGLSTDLFSQLIHDQLVVTNELAYKLSEVLGGSELFWINRYNDYFKEVTFSNEKVYAEYRDILDGLCHARQINITNLLSDFRYSSLEHLVLDYFESPLILYSRTQVFEPPKINLANWIRKCEREAESLIYEGKVNTFSRDSLEHSLLEIISFTKVNRLDNILSKIQEICFSCGVVLLFKSSQSGYGISGFTKKLLNNHRLVIITDRYKNNAAFWFTLLHELAHCVLHDLRYPLIHYSDDEFKLASLKTENIYQEQEADEYVESLLFPDSLKSKIKRCNSYKDIMRLAVSYDISAALIVAQIHRNNIAPYSWYRKVYKRIEFDD